MNRMSTSTQSEPVNQSVTEDNSGDDRLSQSQGLTWDVILLGIPLVGLAPLLLLHGSQLWDHPSFRCYPLVLLYLVVGLLVAEKGVAVSRLRQAFASILALLGFATAVYAAWIFAPRTACVAMIILIVAWGQMRLVHDSLFRIVAWGTLLIVLIPLPRNLDGQMEDRMNGLVGQVTSRILDLVQIYHLLQPPYLAVEKQTLHYFEFLTNAFSARAILLLVLF